MKITISFLLYSCKNGVMTPVRQLLPYKAETSSSAEFLVHRFRNDAKKSDPVKSRCWMLTAKMMMPNSFDVQYEAYNFEKNNGKPKHAAKLLSGMLETFIFNDSQSPIKGAERYRLLWDEIFAIGELLQLIQNGGTPTTSEAKLGKVFEELPYETSVGILLRAAENKNDILQKALIYLASFKRFPQLLTSSKYGSLCLEELMKHLEMPKNVDNQELLSLLVNDLLPLLLDVANVRISVSNHETILKFIARYVFSFITDTKEPGQAINWSIILRNIEAIGKRLRTTEVWFELTKNLEHFEEAEFDMVWQRLMETHQKIDSESARNSIFYVSAFLFLKQLSKYYRLLMPTRSSDRSGFVLVEGFVDHQDTSHPANKRRRTTEEERRLPLISEGQASTLSETPLTTSFWIAVKLYEFLTSQHYEGRWQAFMRDSVGMQFEVSMILTIFNADFAIYHGQYREALQVLRRTPEIENDLVSCTLHTKLASVLFCLGEHSSALDDIVKAVTYANEHFESDSSENLVNEKTLQERRCLKEIKRATVRSRHLHFLELNKQSIISFGCKLLIHVLKDKSLQPTLTDNTDISIGHVIVMLQYCQPDERDLLGLLLHRIRLKDTFVYPNFCHYVVHVDFLEEFASIASADASNLILDPTSSAMSNQRRMGTRGANRGEKSEIRSMLRKQVLRSHENLDYLISKFLLKNRDSIYQCLI